MPLALATSADALPPGTGWSHEEKLDGYRVEAIAADGQVRLLTRSGADWTERFGRVAADIARVPTTSMVFDGEIIARDARKRASFQRLQQSIHDGHTDALHYHVFDLLWLNGDDLRSQPLTTRRTLLAELLRHRGLRSVIHATHTFTGRTAPLIQARALGLEGVMSKRLDAAYVGGRTSTWIKTKITRGQEFVVVGYTEPKGSRTGIGALLLGVYATDGTLRYAGKVGTGFDRLTLTALRTQLRCLETTLCPVVQDTHVPNAGVHWVAPSLVVEISFAEWTAGGLLRQPVFKGVREDKLAIQVHRESA